MGAGPLLTQLTAADPRDEDARAKLARAQRERHWQLRYEEICELRDDDEWEAVLGALDDLEQERPGYPDPQKLRAWAEARQRREQYYDTALAAFDRAEWPAAITALETLLTDAPDDAEAQALLQRARAEQQVAEEQARRQQEQAHRREQEAAARAQEQRFEPAITLLRSKNFGEALEQFEQLLQQPDDCEFAAQLVASLIERADVPLEQRMRAARMVDAVGDPRPGLQIENPKYWARRIEPGPFLMGDNNSGESDEKPAFVYHIRQPYALARYLVTNSQYARFLADLERRGKTEEAQRRRPRRWESNNPPAGKGNHPVVNVSWEDATAFAAWADETLRMAGLLGPGETVRLPTEPEWERAAAYPVVIPHPPSPSPNLGEGAMHSSGGAGAERRKYPWGEWPTKDIFANTYESGIGGTSAVGLFPQGAADCGALDMAGNVWEWCSTPYLPYKEIAKRGQVEAETLDNFKSENGYVLRGGSWNHDRSLARCGARALPLPCQSLGYYGFRVARCSPRS